MSKAPKDAGTYIVKASTNAHGYSFDNVYKTFFIKPKKVSVTPNVLKKPFGEIDPDFTDVSFDISEIIEGEKLTISGAYTLEDYHGNVGTYNCLIGTLEPSSKNYDLEIDGQFKVVKREIDDSNITVIKNAVADSDGWAYPADAVSMTVELYGKKTEMEPALFDNKGNYISGDYEIISVTKTKKLGKFSVQIKGVGNYYGFAEAMVDVVNNICYVNVKNGKLSD